MNLSSVVVGRPIYLLKTMFIFTQGGSWMYSTANRTCWLVALERTMTTSFINFSELLLVGINSLIVSFISLFLFHLYNYYIINRFGEFLLHISTPEHYLGTIILFIFLIIASIGHFYVRTWQLPFRHRLLNRIIFNSTQPRTSVAPFLPVLLNLFPLTVPGVPTWYFWAMHGLACMCRTPVIKVENYERWNATTRTCGTQCKAINSERKYTWTLFRGSGTVFTALLATL